MTALAGAAWYLAGERIAIRLGQDEVAPAVGILLGAVTALTLWRRNAADQLDASLRRLVCPACRGPLETSHEHAGEVQPGGLQAWTCASCGYAHASTLTCAECAQ